MTVRFPAIMSTVRRTTTAVSRMQVSKPSFRPQPKGQEWLDAWPGKKPPLLLLVPSCGTVSSDRFIVPGTDQEADVCNVPPIRATERLQQVPASLLHLIELNTLWQNLSPHFHIAESQSNEHRLQENQYGPWEARTTCLALLLQSLMVCSSCM